MNLCSKAMCAVCLQNRLRSVRWNIGCFKLNYESDVLVLPWIQQQTETPNAQILVLSKHTGPQLL